MNDAIAAALSVFAGGFLAGVAFVGVLQRRTRSISPSPRASVALRLRAIRRSRVADVEQRLDLLERVIARPSAMGAAVRPHAEPDALEALQSLGYNRKEATALLAATPDGDTTEERIAAVLRVAGARR